MDTFFQIIFISCAIITGPGATPDKPTITLVPESCIRWRSKHLFHTLDACKARMHEYVEADYVTALGDKAGEAAKRMGHNWLGITTNTAECTTPDLEGMTPIYPGSQA